MKRRKDAERKKKERQAKKIKKQEEMEQKQQMLDDIKDEALNPLNIQIPLHLSQRAQDESYQIKLRMIHDKIDEKRYGSEGKPLYEDCCDYYRH